MIRISVFRRSSKIKRNSSRFFGGFVSERVFLFLLDTFAFVSSTLFLFFDNLNFAKLLFISFLVENVDILEANDLILAFRILIGFMLDEYFRAWLRCHSSQFALFYSFFQFLLMLVEYILYFLGEFFLSLILLADEFFDRLRTVFLVTVGKSHFYLFFLLF